MTKVGNALTRRRKDAVKHPEKSIHMAARPTMTVTEECHTKERLKKDLKVCSGCKPIAKQLVGVTVALADEEKTK